MRITRPLSLAIAGVAATSSLCIAGTANAVTGGGCTANQISPCISDSNGYIWSDFYVNNNVYLNASCTAVRFLLRDITTSSNVFDDTQSYWCAQGHHPVAYYGHNIGDTYMTIAYMITPNGTLEVKSPELHY